MKEAVYAAVRSIPAGKVATYGQIGAMLGNRNLARAVGNILHRNPSPGEIPCHRVVNARGEPAKHFAFGGAEAQKRLLQAEGVAFGPEGRVDLETYGVKIQEGRIC